MVYINLTVRPTREQFSGMYRSDNSCNPISEMSSLFAELTLRVFYSKAILILRSY